MLPQWRLSVQLRVLLIWLYLRPFRTVAWAVSTMVIGFAAKHAFHLGTTALEVVITVSNLVGITLATWAMLDSYGDYRYQIATNGNGKTEVADEEVGQDAVRITAALTLFVVGVMLLRESPNPSYEALVAKHGVMFASWYLLAAIVRERISRRELIRRARSAMH
jgi:hypothetical protein